MLSFSSSNRLSAEVNDTNERFLFKNLWHWSGEEGRDYSLQPLAVFAEKINGEYILQKNGDVLPDGVLAYCLDFYLMHPSGDLNYSNLDNIPYDIATQEKVRAILMESLPNKSLESLHEISGLSDLNIGEAYTTTQYAIWMITNPESNALAKIRFSSFKT